MASQPPIPPLLSPYLSSQPSHSLTLLTGTLGATVNWLVLRFLAAIASNAGLSDIEDTTEQPDRGLSPKVILMSWLRNPTVWQDGGRKLRIKTSAISVIAASDAGLSPGPGPHGLADLEHTLSTSIAEFKASCSNQNPIILILDGLDFLPAATACSVTDLLAIVTRLREQVDATIITSNADSALLHAQTSPLEISHAAFTLSLAHQARMVMSVRELETGGRRTLVVR
ncbi:uncharacterized protein KY384_001074 [Bacidia gigantensis]|uniref:uncharacterized protein n=1 Tax=Bacidia gigantensis TaxID=2732470 RepID=UPI001D05504B|nr:uncharacterized protein KY384_001074 [Bacidia gigantensis]KAG8534230.1 hypothetical protein KY384_001074 [Bacidia gigantensis]